MKISVKKTFAALLALLLLFAMPLSSQAASPKKQGNTSGNLQNDGFAVEADGWIYFYANNNLYRTQAGKDQPEVFVRNIDSMLPDRFWGNMNVARGWIYFNTLHGSIYRISTDGGKPELFLSGKTGNYMVGVCEFIIVDDWLYYNYETSSRSSLNRTSMISRMRLDKSGNQTLVGGDKTSMMWLNEVADGYIYYVGIETDSENFYNYRIPISGGTPERLTIIPYSPFVQISDGWLYYTDGGSGGSLARVRPDGSDRQVIYNQGICSSYNVAGDWIYCLITPQEGDFNNRYYMRIRPDGSDMQILIEKTTLFSGSVAGDIICSNTSGTLRLQNNSAELHVKKLFIGYYE